MVTGRVRWHLHPAFPEYADAPHPPRVGDTVEPFFEWLVLHQFDDMFCGVSAPNFVWLQRENMVEFQQQGYHLLGQLRRPFLKAIQPTIPLKGSEEEVLPLLH